MARTIQQLRDQRDRLADEIRRERRNAMISMRDRD
jgi:hypothetical protein